MDRSRKVNREGSEVTLQHKSRQEAMGVEELCEDKLAQLLTFVQSLEIPAKHECLATNLEHRWLRPMSV